MKVNGDWGYRIIEPRTNPQSDKKILSEYFPWNWYFVSKNIHDIRHVRNATKARLFQQSVYFGTRNADLHGSNKRRGLHRKYQLE